MKAFIFSFLLIISFGEKASGKGNCISETKLPHPSEIPDTMYIAKNYELVLRFKNFIPLVSDLKFQIYENHTLLGYSDSYTFKTQNIGCTNVFIRVEDSHKFLVAEYTTVISCIENNFNAGIKRILFIGNSLTDGTNGAGLSTKNAVKNFFKMDGGINAEFIGTRQNETEGWPGYSVTDFSSYGRRNYKFHVNKMDVLPSIEENQYSHNGSAYLLREIRQVLNGTDLIMEKIFDKSEPLSKGGLLKIAGVGEDSLFFDSWSYKSGNPFWNETTSKIDFKNYANTYSYPSIDIAVIQLGINDLYGTMSFKLHTSLPSSVPAAGDLYSTNGVQYMLKEVFITRSGMDVIIEGGINLNILPQEGQLYRLTGNGSQLINYNSASITAYHCLSGIKRMIDALKDPVTGFPNCKIVISNEPPGKFAQISFDSNHFRYIRNMQFFRNDVYKLFADNNYNKDVRVANSDLNIDMISGYDQDDIIHPNGIGYMQMAPAIYSTIRSFFQSSIMNSPSHEYFR
jgi:lysophospholipase L1-like esterase